MPAQSEYIQTVAGVVVQVQANVYVQLTNNDTAVAYVSAAASDSAGKVSFTPAPPSGVYTVATGPSNVGPWTGSGNSSYVVPEPSSSQTIAYAASIAIDASAGRDVSIGTLTGNLTLANPTNAAKGRTLSIKLTQDGTGGRTLAVGTAWDLGLWTINPAPNAVSHLSVKYDGTSWRALTSLQGTAQVVNVRDFGAKGDNSADDTAAINAALAIGGTVHVPRGNYKVTGPIVAKETTNVTLAGVGGLSSGSATATTFTFTGTSGRVIDARSSAGFALKDIYVNCTDPTFAGTAIDLSHSIASDSAYTVLRGCNVFINGVTAGSVGVLLNQAIFTELHDMHLSGGQTQIQGGVGSYSNAIQLMNIVHNLQAGSTAITGMRQSWKLDGIFLEANGNVLTGNLIDGSANVLNGLFIDNMWAGDFGAGSTCTIINLAGLGITIGPGCYLSTVAGMTAISFAGSTTGVAILGPAIGGGGTGIAWNTAAVAHVFYMGASNAAATPTTGTVIDGFQQISGGVQLSGSLNFDTAVSRIIPGATSLALRNNANNADNLLVTDVGAVTARAGITSNTGAVNLTTAAGVQRSLAFQTAGVNRWIIAANGTAEGGANAGSNFIINALSDAGADLGNPFSINRATRLITIGNGLSMSASPVIGAMSTETFSGAITITVDATKGNTHLIPATSNTASTLTPSAAGTAGQWLYIVLTSDATGGNVITFANTFKPNGTLTLGVSKKQVVSFLSDGTNWIEMARGPAV